MAVMERRGSAFFETGSCRVYDAWSGKASGATNPREQEAGGWTDFTNCHVIKKKQLIKVVQLLSGMWLWFGQF